MISADVMTHRYAAVLAILFNVLATAMLFVSVDAAGTVGQCVPMGVVANLFSYLVLIGALRVGASGAMGD